MLRERFGGTQPQAVAALIAASQQPVTLSQLQAGLQTIEPQLQHAAQGGNWWSELSSDIAGLILFKRESEPVIQPVAQMRDARQRTRADEGRVGQERVSTCRSRWSR